ncbi:MAG: magnesium/cobalt efflux protein, partial [Treponema sp.]|nr:magnesium/cobalt efflux protein [Treponema sp.]
MQQQSLQSKLLAEEVNDMIEGVKDLSETTVKEVMVPRIDVDFISSDTPKAELVTKIIASGHSRFPVYTDSIDNVVGV